MPFEDEVERRRNLVARELEVLEAARHPGVVEVVAVDEGPDGPSLRTAPVDGVLLAQRAPLTTEEVGGTVAAVASTLADLHDLGLVHGAVSAERILVRADGRPVLFGFGYGGRAGETLVGRAELAAGATDPAGEDGSPLDPAADVFAIGVLLRELAERAAGAPGGPQGQRSRSAGRATDALLRVADRATVADRHLRPSARALAAAVGHAVPGARLPRGSATAAPPDAGSRNLVTSPVDDGSQRADHVDPLLALRRRGAGRGAAEGVGGRRASSATSRPGSRRLVAGVGVVVVAGVAGSVALAATSTTSPPRPAPSETAEGGGATGAAGSTGPTVHPTGVTTTTVARPRPAVDAPAGRSCAPVTASLSADTDGDGCSEALRWADGVIEAAGNRWVVGLPGDQVATGDWACAGARSLALLRPSTGEVFVFDGWAVAGRDLTATARAVVEGGFALRAGDLDADGCPELLVDRSGREAVRVPTAAAP